MDLPRMVAEVTSLHLRGERIELRRFGPGDLAVAMLHEQDPQLMRHIRDIEPPDILRARVEGYRNPWRGGDGEWLALVIALRSDGNMIGHLALRVTVAAHQTVEIGYRLHHAFWRQGLAHEACQTALRWLFRDIGVRKVVAHCIPANTASFRLMEKLGMQREGVLREWGPLGGGWPDEYVYGLLAREWQEPGDRG